MKSSSSEMVSLLFFANFAKLMTSSHVLLKLVRKCFLEIFYNILLFKHFFFHFTSSGKGGGFLSKSKKLNFCKRLYLNGHTFQKYYLLRVTLLFYLFLKGIHRTKQVSHFQGSIASIRKSYYYYYDLPSSSFWSFNFNHEP